MASDSEKIVDSSSTKENKDKWEITRNVEDIKELLQQIVDNQEKELGNIADAAEIHEVEAKLLIESKLSKKPRIVAHDTGQRCLLLMVALIIGSALGFGIFSVNQRFTEAFKDSNPEWITELMDNLENKTEFEKYTKIMKSRLYMITSASHVADDFTLVSVKAGSLNYVEAKAVCEENGMEVGLIKDEKDLDMIKNITLVIFQHGTATRYHVWTGLEIDVKTGQLFPTGSFTKWLNSYPDTEIRSTHPKNVCLEVDPDGKTGFMMNSAPSFIAEAVLCRI